MMPADRTADLVVVEAGRDHLLDPLPLRLHADQSGHEALGSSSGHVVVEPRLTAWTDHHPPLLRPDPTVWLGPDSHRQGGRQARRGIEWGMNMVRDEGPPEAEAWGRAHNQEAAGGSLESVVVML
jgi:hypothetical protein